MDKWPERWDHCRRTWHSAAIFPDGWIALFTQDPLVHVSAKDFIQIAGPRFFFQGLGLSLYFASEGANAMLWPVLATIIRVAVVSCVSLSLGFIFDVGLVGIYYGSALGMTSYAIIIAGALKFGAWLPSAKWLGRLWVSRSQRLSKGFDQSSKPNFSGARHQALGLRYCTRPRPDRRQVDIADYARRAVFDCRTFADFFNRPEHIPTNLLSERLKRLVTFGALEKVAY